VRAPNDPMSASLRMSVFLFVQLHLGKRLPASPNDDGLSIRCFFAAFEAGRFTVSSGRELGTAQSGRLLRGLGLDQHPHDVTLVHDEVLDTTDLDLGARPFGMRSPTFPSMGISLPLSSRPPGPTATTLPCCGFSFAVSGMIMPKTAQSAWLTGSLSNSCLRVSFPARLAVTIDRDRHSHPTC
jgi:hypothetical protein